MGAGGQRLPVCRLGAVDNFSLEINAQRRSRTFCRPTTGTSPLSCRTRTRSQIGPRQHVAGCQGIVHPGPDSLAACRRDQSPQTPREQIFSLKRQRRSVQHLPREPVQLNQPHPATRLACANIRHPGIPSVDCPARFPDAPPTQILKEQGIFQSSWQHPDQQVKPGPTADTQWLL